MSLALLRKPTRVDKISQALPQLSRGWQLGSLPAPNSFHCFVSLGTKELTHASAWSLELCQLLIQMSKLTSLKGDRQHLLLQAFKLRELTEKFKWWFPNIHKLFSRLFLLSCTKNLSLPRFISIWMRLPELLVCLQNLRAVQELPIIPSETNHRSNSTFSRL